MHKGVTQHFIGKWMFQVSSHSKSLFISQNSKIFMQLCFDTSCFISLEVVDTGSSIHDPIRNSKKRAENQRKISFIIVLGVDVGHELSQNRPLLEVPDVA